MLLGLGACGRANLHANTAKHWAQDMVPETSPPKVDRWMLAVFGPIAQCLTSDPARARSKRVEVMCFKQVDQDLFCSRPVRMVDLLCLIRIALPDRVQHIAVVRI